MGNYLRFLVFQVLLILLGFVISCSKIKKNDYEIECDNSKKLAQNDFKYKNYTWTDFAGLGFDFFGNDEFVQILKQNNIKHKRVGVSCIRDGYEKYENCYEVEMNRLLEEKFDKKYFDSLKIEGKKQFAFKSKDSIFEYEMCDETSRYPNTNDFRLQQFYFFEDFKRSFVYPKNYIKATREEPESISIVTFVLMKNAAIKNVKIETKLQNPKNKIFEKDINQQVEKYVKSIHWKPATIEGIPVNSLMKFYVKYG